MKAGCLKEKLALVALWLLFGGLWYRVYTFTTVLDLKGSVVYLGSILSAYGLLVTAWIVHNLHIYRRKGPRQGARVMSYVGTHDALQSYIMTKTDLKQTQAITVNVVNGRKLFLQTIEQRERDLAASM